MKQSVAEDGTLEVTFHQSFLNDYFMCPARAMWNIERFPEGTPPSTASALGTAMHSGIEAHYHGADVGHAIKTAWEAEESVPGFVRDPKMDRVKALAMARACFDAWVRDVEPHVGVPDNLEQRFKIMVDHRPDVRLYIAGTADAVVDGIVWDWKTTGGMYGYQQWQVDRWFIQPTVYTLAQAHIENWWEPRLFNYGIMEKRKRPVGHIIRTVRSEKNWQHLVQQMWSIFDNIRTAVAYPLNDQGWWCDAKWCAHWSSCKGSH